MQGGKDAVKCPFFPSFGGQVRRGGAGDGCLIKERFLKCLHTYTLHVNQRYLILKLNLTKRGGKLTLTLHVSLMKTINPGFFLNSMFVCLV